MNPNEEKILQEMSKLLGRPVPVIRQELQAKKSVFYRHFPELNQFWKPKEKLK